VDDGRERVVTDSQPDLGFELVQEGLRWLDDSLDLVQVLEFQEDHRRYQEFRLLDGSSRFGGELVQLPLAEPNHNLGVQITDHSSDQSLSHSDSISLSKSWLARSKSVCAATTVCLVSLASLEGLISGTILKTTPLCVNSTGSPSKARSASLKRCCRKLVMVTLTA